VPRAQNFGLTLNLAARRTFKHTSVRNIGKRSIAMLKAGIIAFAVLILAGGVLLFSGPRAKEAVVSPAQASSDGAAAKCAKRDWPYLHCIGTPAGNLRIRLITTDRLPR
jgi:hypothetical protein